jgi:hypothetical protein
MPAHLQSDPWLAANFRENPLGDDFANQFQHAMRAKLPGIHS